uniref:Uncharacterized protein n=1 Tax=Brassica oleracea var. oleracea TaxID=109376 RepID=A0A0D3D9K5_BRAOL
MALVAQVCVKPLLLSSHSLETLSRYIPTGVHFHLFHHKEEDYGTSLPRRSRANAIEQHKTCFTQFKTSQLSSVAARTQAHILSKTFSSSLFRNCFGILIFVCEFESYLFYVPFLGFRTGLLRRLDNFSNFMPKREEREIGPNKYDTRREKYTKFRKLTKNRIGLGFDNLGRINMSNDWWSEREKECPGIRRSIWKEEFNMYLFEEEFCAVVVTGAEGWSAQHGEASLNSRVGGDDGDEADYQSASETETQAAAETETQPQAQTKTQRQTHSGSSRGKRKRKEKDMVVEACDKRTEALMVKNRIAEQMLERQETSSVENVLQILYTLPGVREWSPLYEATMEHLIDNEESRRTFITMKIDEAKIKFLELRTKINRDD